MPKLYRFGNCRYFGHVFDVNTSALFLFRINGKYTAFGKLGLAIIGLAVQNKYEIILYKDKQNVNARVKINESLTVCLKNDCFISFYDILKDNWLIKFSSELDLESIIMQVEKLGGIFQKEAPKPLAQPEAIKTVDILKTEIESENQTEIIAELNASQAKTDILNRIAKMGQSILPNKITETDDNLSTSSNETRTLENQLSPVLVHHTRPIHSTPPTTTIVGQYYDPISMLFTENRTHNAEVRMNLSQISEKLNNLVKVVDGQKPSSDITELKSKLKVLQLKNENLERDLLKMHDEKRKLQEVAQDKSLLDALENSRMELKLEKGKNESKVNELSDELNKSKELAEAMSKRVEALNVNAFEKDDRITQLEQKINTLEEQINTTKLPKESNVKDLCNNFKPILKASMNEMYHKIVYHLLSISNQPSPDFQDIIAQNVKSTTLNIMQHLERLSDNDKPQ